MVSAYGVRGDCFEDALFRLFLALFKERGGQLGKPVVPADNGTVKPAADAGGESLCAGIVVFCVATIGEYEVGRGVEGEFVQSGDGVHQIGVDIQLMAVTCHLQCTFTCMVVSVVTVVAVVDDGVEAAVLGGRRCGMRPLLWVVSCGCSMCGAGHGGGMF